MQENNKLKPGIEVINKRGIYYVVEDGGRLLKFKPWLGDAFSFLYDFIMRNSIFPKKFGGDINQHFAILTEELKGVHKKRVLELAAGSGSAVNFLPNDNQYTGSDISTGLLKRAVKNFRNAGFKNTEFYVSSAEEVPFGDNRFEVILCILSLNFFRNIKEVLQEIKRVASPEALFICSVPVPERNRLKSTIRGTLYSKEELEKLCQEYGFSFESLPAKNGSLLYFRAVMQ
jgi:SAM-dependent methyltransferase